MRRGVISTMVLGLIVVSLVIGAPGAHAAVEPKWTYDTYDSLWEVAVSGDGSRVVAGDMSNYVYMLDGDGNLLWKYETGGTVFGVAISLDGRYSVAGSGDGKLYFFDDASGDVLWYHDFGTEVLDAYISLDGNYVIAGLDNGTVYLFDRTGRKLWSYTTDDAVMSVALSRTGYYIGIASSDGYIYLLTRYGNLIWKKKLLGTPESIAISPGGGYVAAGDGDYYVYLYTRGGDLVWKYETSDDVWGLSVSSDGKFTVAGADQIYVFDKTGSVVWSYNTGELVRGAGVSPNGQYIVAGDDNYKVYYFYLPQSALVRETTRILGHTVTIQGVVSTEENTRAVYNETASVDYTYRTIIQKVSVMVNGVERPGYLINHEVQIQDVTGNVRAFRTVYTISKDVAYSVDDMILPYNAIVIKREPIIALDIKDPQAGDKANQTIIILTDVSESQFTQGVEITHQVITSDASSSSPGDSGSKVCGPAAFLPLVVLPLFLRKLRR